MIYKAFLISLIFVFFSDFTVIAEPLNAADFSLEEAPFFIKINGEERRLKLSPLFVSPGETITIQNESARIKLSCTSSSGTFTNEKDGCKWQAPEEKGYYKLLIRDGLHRESITLQAFVLVPFNKLKGEYLNGYHIGNYPIAGDDDAIITNTAYHSPKGFIEVTPENEDALLSPHFSLKQFLCKDESAYPKYVVLQERLPLKLEQILKEVNTHGISTPTFFIMSGYRTPYYNEKIENVKFSRHVFGDAADIFIPHGSEEEYQKYGFMEVNSIYKVVNNMERLPVFAPFIGGMGLYHPTSAHPAFLHIDVRGRSARW